MRNLIGNLSAAIVGVVLLYGIVYPSTHEFFKGKTLRVMVGVGAGGGFDTYSRTIARHLGKHISGNPNVIGVCRALVNLGK